MLTWTGATSTQRQEVRGLIVQPRWRVPAPEDLGPPRWFAPLTLAFIVAFILAGAWTVLKALDLALLTWSRVW